MSFLQGLSTQCTLRKITSYKNANCNDNTLFPLLGHIQSGKLKSYWWWDFLSFLSFWTEEGDQRRVVTIMQWKKTRESWTEREEKKRKERGEHYLKEWKTALWEPATLK